MKIDVGGNFRYKLLCGNSKEALKNIPDNTFHTAITSPPYWMQRDYNVEGQLGQENTPEEYVDSLVAICREVKRTLRTDGTFWLNIGDGYCSKTIKSSDIKPKDLIGVPWLLAFAMRKDGWYLRSDIIWQKENPQPDSSKSRPAKSYEHLFLFSKSKKYFYDWFAIAEDQKAISIRRAYSKNNVNKRKDFENDNYAISGSSQDKTYERMREKLKNLKDGETLKCNKKDVWTTPTAAEKAEHFAIFPGKLIIPCVLAGSSSKGCCPKCKTPWDRVGEANEWKSGCDCGVKEVEPCIVLDPFNGSGTTGRVCHQTDRKYVGVDISEKYLDIARDEFKKYDAMGIGEVGTIEEILE